MFKYLVGHWKLHKAGKASDLRGRDPFLTGEAMNVCNQLLWKSNKYYTFWVCVYSLRYPVCNVHVPYYVICGLSGCTSFPHYLLNDMIFKREVQYFGLHVNHSLFNFMNICPVGAKLFRVNGQTDMTKLTAAFRNFANAPKNQTWGHWKIRVRGGKQLLIM